MAVSDQMNMSSELPGQQAVSTEMLPTGARKSTIVETRDNSAEPALHSHPSVPLNSVSGHILKTEVGIKAPMATPVQGISESELDELTQLTAELTHIQERRLRLLQLQELDEEEERIKRQIAEINRR